MKHWRIFFGVVLFGTMVRAETNLIAPQDVPAYSMNPPHEQRGLFPKGGQLHVMDQKINGLVRVQFLSSSGRRVEALCRQEDLRAASPATQSPAPAPGMRIPGSEYNEREWLEDAEGHKRATEFQSKYDNQMLIFFYADWNESCTFLWKELLSTSDFKKETAKIVKLRINPEHGKEEGELAAKYNLRRYPSTFMIDKPFAKPRSIDLMFWSFGKMKTLNVEKSLLEIAGGMNTQQVQQAGESTNSPVGRWNW